MTPKSARRSVATRWQFDRRVSRATHGEAQSFLRELRECFVTGGTILVMSRTPSTPILRGSRLLQAMGSASQIASRLPGASVRSIQVWKSGGKPNGKHRQLLETALGIPEASWQPAPTAFEAALAASLAGVIGEALRAHHERLQPPASQPGEAG